MLTLYHNDMSTCAQKVRFALAEKGLEWEGPLRIMTFANGNWQRELAELKMIDTQ